MSALYVLDLDRWDPERAYSHLSAARRARAEGYLRPQSRRQCLGAGVVLDYALSLHGLREREAVLERDPGGKPRLWGRGLHFSLSHSGPWVVCALSQDGPVGVDVQTLRVPRRGLVRRVCHPEEWDRAAAPADFTRLWRGKESFLKYLGLGLDAPLREVRVELDRGRVTWKGVPQAVRLWEFDRWGCPATVCALAPCGPLQFVPSDFLDQYV